MSLSDITTASAWIAVLAIVALVATGWRKPARVTVASTRATRRSLQRGHVAVADVGGVPHRPTPVWRRIWAVLAGSSLAVVTGAVIAIVLSLGLGWIVVTLSDLLRR
jgi:ABC-type dipeptide/oligopeptide/nickel transport system permease subunit